MNKKMQDIIKSFDQNQLKEINEFLNSAEGARLKRQLSGDDKEKLMNEFSKLSTNDIKRAVSSMSGRNLKNIINKL